MRNRSLRARGRALARNGRLALLAGLLGVAASAGAQDDSGNGLVIYDNGLSEPWMDRSWANVEYEKEIAGDVRPIKVTGDGWSALVFKRRDAVPLEDYSVLRFFINGGTEGGQRVCLLFGQADQTFKTDFCVTPNVRSWNVVEVPLNEVKGTLTGVDRILFKNGTPAAHPAYYLTKIELR